MRREAWLLVPIVLCALRLEIGPDVYDAGELAAAAALLGAAHPPGEPLHALLGHAATFVPLGSIPFRLAALSLAGEALAAYLVLRIARRVAKPSGPLSTLAPHAAAACALLAPPLLRQATRVEVYGPALALSLYGVHEALGALERRPGALARACLCAGLAAALHPPHLVAPLAMALVVALAERRSVVHAGTFFFSALLLSAGAVTYLYLPLRARASAPMWGDPQSLSGLWDYVSAAAYRPNLATSTGFSLALVLGWLGYAARAVGYLPVLGVALALLPSAWLGRTVEAPRALRLLAAAAPLALVGAMIQPLEERNPDNVAYAAPAVAMLCAAGAVALGRALDRSGKVLGATALGLFALNPLSLGAAYEGTTAAPPALETLAAAFVESPPTRALVVVESDFAAGAWMSARAVDGARPDTALFVTGLGTSSWHWRSLAGHPAFDGRPVRGPGESPRVAYPRGAVTLAHGRVPVAIEPSWLTPPGAQPVGAFALFPGAEEPRSARLALAHATSEAARLPLGDHDVAGAVVRDAIVRRAGHLAAIGRRDEALRWLERLLFWLPERERALVLAPTGAPSGPAAAWVRDENAYLVGPEDVVRAASVLLASGGATDAALELLRAQAERGDELALAQRDAIVRAGGRPRP